MNLSIVGIADRGIANRERLHLLVLAPTNLSYYAILDTIYLSPTAISSIPKHIYWFKSFQVKAGDNVVLYTGPGTQKSEYAANGRSNHFFYWGLPKTIWNQKSDCAVVLEIASWMTSNYT